MKTYPLPEQLSIKVTKPAGALTTFERLLLAELLEAIARVKRSLHDRPRKDTP